MKLGKIIFWITGTSIEEAGMLFCRGALWVLFTAPIAAILLGLVAVYNEYGLPAMYGAVALLYLLYLGMQRGSSGYLDDGSMWLGGDKALPPPGKQRLPRPGPPQIGRASTAVASSRPGSVARR
jgi:hypothetical protein